MNPNQVLVVITTLPDEDSAHAMAARLIEARLAACVQVQAPCTSVYRWQGEVEQASEVPIWIKTRGAKYQTLEAAIRASHPYELPEIIAMPVVDGLPDYLAWVVSETAED